MPAVAFDTLFIRCGRLTSENYIEKLHYLYKYF